ncbi:MAG: hypothetical protein ACYC4I_02295 [Minisyncoccota bacterium]
METTCKKCESKNIIGVEYPHDHPEHYDGVSEVECRDCGARFGRFSGRELAEGEAEKASARFA